MGAFNWFSLGSRGDLVSLENVLDVLHKAISAGQASQYGGENAIGHTDPVTHETIGWNLFTYAAELLYSFRVFLQSVSSEPQTEEGLLELSLS